jgi:predicted nucleotidyltransferase component of viral defense system
MLELDISVDYTYYHRVNPKPENIQVVERFHLIFLAQLGTRLDKKLYALKGGCNLRFFWKSIRYSEDIDFDVHTMTKQTLQNNVRKIMQGPALNQILRAAKIHVVHISEPKQTPTTQRWKVHLQTESSGIDLPTRIEFSRRKFDRGIVFGPADNELVSAYNLRPVMASHYDVETAFSQKIEALLNRKQTQARDIFDLEFLSERGAIGSAVRIDRTRLASACEIVMSVAHEQFLGQVVAYLPPEYYDYYRTRKAWDVIRENVVRTLEAL